MSLSFRIILLVVSPDDHDLGSINNVLICHVGPAIVVLISWHIWSTNCLVWFFFHGFRNWSWFFLTFCSLFGRLFIFFLFYGLRCHFGSFLSYYFPFIFDNSLLSPWFILDFVINAWRLVYWTWRYFTLLLNSLFLQEWWHFRILNFIFNTTCLFLNLDVFYCLQSGCELLLSHEGIRPHLPKLILLRHEKGLDLVIMILYLIILSRNRGLLGSSGCI